MSPIWAPNRFEWVLTQYATARIGAILVNINPAYKARELAHALNQSGTRLLLLSQGFRQTSYTALLDEVRAGCRELQEALVIDEQWQALLGDASTVDDATLAERESLLSFDDPINIQYTSGTTGTPKARRYRTTTSSTTASSVGKFWDIPTRTESASLSPSTTASAW